MLSYPRTARHCPIPLPLSHCLTPRPFPCLTVSLRGVRHSQAREDLQAKVTKAAEAAATKEEQQATYLRQLATSETVQLEAEMAEKALAEAQAVAKAKRELLEAVQLTASDRFVEQAKEDASLAREARERAVVRAEELAAAAEVAKEEMARLIAEHTAAVATSELKYANAQKVADKELEADAKGEIASRLGEELEQKVRACVRMARGRVRGRREGVQRRARSIGAPHTRAQMRPTCASPPGRART